MVSQCPMFSSRPLTTCLCELHSPLLWNKDNCSLPGLPLGAVVKVRQKEVKHLRKGKAPHACTRQLPSSPRRPSPKQGVSTSRLALGRPCAETQPQAQWETELPQTRFSLSFAQIRCSIHVTPIKTCDGGSFTKQALMRLE